MKDKLSVKYLLVTADLIGGTEQAVIHQANALARRGHHIEIVSVFRDSKDPHFDIDKRVQVSYAIDRRGRHVLPNKLARKYVKKDADSLNLLPSRIVDPSWDKQFTSLCDLTLPQLLMSSITDVVVAPTPPLAAFAARYSNGAVIVQQEHRPTAYRNERVLERIQQYLPEVDALVSLTDRSTTWIQSHLAPPGLHLSTIPNMNPDGFYPQSSCQAKVIVGAGRLASQKRFAHLIEAFSVIADEFPDWSVRIFGEGPERRKAEQAIEKYGLSEQVHILPFVSDLKDELSKASIVAMTSVFEGLPLVGLEALATGVPFVSYDIPTGPSEIIEDGVNGFLVPVEDTPGFADRLRILMSDPDLRRRMGQAARESAERYTETTVSEQWEELFKELIESKHESQKGQTFGVPSDASLEQAVCPLCPAESASRALTTVLKLLSDYDIPWAPIAPYGPAPTIAIMESSLFDLSKAFVSIAEPVIIRLSNANGSDARWVSSPSQLPQNVKAARPQILSVATEATLEEARASDHACFTDIEIWAQSLSGTFKPARHNRVEDEVENSFFSSPVIDGGPEELNRMIEGIWSVPQFPIDLVYTWVDGNDPDWLARKQLFSSDAAQVQEEAKDTTRFEDREELRYSLRSVAAFAPWVNNIYLVTDHQLPAWLDTSDPRIHVVDHADIFPDSSVLPVFNSHSIETTLHRIPGLSEHYIVMNDDVILRRPVTKDQFFTAAGQARFFLSPVKIGNGPNPAPHIEAARNNRKLIQARFGKTVTQCFLHTPHPHLKSVVQEIEDEFPQEIRRTRASRFRSPRDVSLCSSFAQYYGFFTHSYVQGSIRYSYLQVNAPTTERKMKQILKNHRIDTFAVGENTGALEQEGTNVQLREFLEQIVPWKSPFEID